MDDHGKEQQPLPPFGGDRPAGGGDQQVENPDPEVSEKPTRRRYSAEYKLKILRQADKCTKRGELGALLRREGKQVGGHRVQVPITISTQEFTQRWSEHIQPEHLTKVRYFGGRSNSKVGQYMQRCYDLSAATPVKPPSSPTTRTPIGSKRISSAKAAAVIEWCCSANCPNQAGESLWVTGHRRVHRGTQTSGTSQIGSSGTV